MPSLQSFAATFSNLFGGNPADLSAASPMGADKKSSSDQFSSLLDVVGNIGDDNNNAIAPVSRKNDVKDPVAVVADAPVSFRDNKNNDTVKATEKNIDDNNVIERKSSVTTKKAGNDKDDSQKTESLTAKNESQEANDSKKANSAIANANNDNNASDKTDEIAELDKLKEKIADRVDDLSNLMGIISRLLAGANGATTHVEFSFVSQTTVQISDMSAINSDDGQNADALAIFANLKDVLKQLEQFLQAVNGQDTPFTEGQNDTLSAINAALQNDLNGLKNLFPQAVDGDDAQSIFNQLLETQKTIQLQDIDDKTGQQSAFSPVEDVKSLLQDDIASIKAALLKFKNEQLSTHVRPEIETPKIQLTVMPQMDTLSVDNVSVVKQENGKNDLAIFANVVQAAAIPVVEQTQNQNNNSSVNPIAVAVQQSSRVTDVDTNAGGNFSNNSGQGGNSQAHLSFGATSAGTQVRGAGANSTQFSSLLNRSEHVPVAEQVVFHVKTAIGNGSSKITLQLNPEELGKLDITLDVDVKGKTGVTITADNKQTLDLLQRDSQGLQKALSDAGLKADSGSLSFNLRGGEREGQGQNQSQAANQYRKSQPDDLLPEEVNMASLAVATRSYVINLPDGLDIKI